MFLFFSLLLFEVVYSTLLTHHVKECCNRFRVFIIFVFVQSDKYPLYYVVRFLWLINYCCNQAQAIAVVMIIQFLEHNFKIATSF